MNKWFFKFKNDEKGINTVEIVVLVAIAIGLALIFREQLLSYIDALFDITFDPSKVTIPSGTTVP